MVFAFTAFVVGGVFLSATSDFFAPATADACSGSDRLVGPALEPSGNRNGSLGPVGSFGVDGGDG